MSFVEARKSLLISGYIKELRKKHQMVKSVPDAISGIIVAFYMLTDTWSERYSHESIKIDETKTIMTNNTCYTYMTYGEAVIDKGIFEWELKLLQLSFDEHHYAPYIGIIQDNKDLMDKQRSDPEWTESGAGYTLDTEFGDIVSANRCISNHELIFLKESDTLTMTLNLEERSLTYQVNDGVSVVFDNIEQARYRLAVGTCCNGGDTSFQILP